MKKLVLSVMVYMLLAACNSDGSVNEQKIDAAGEKLQNTVESTADTIVNKVDRWADSLDEHNKKDTLY